MEKVLWELLSGRLVAIVRGVGPEEIVDTCLLYTSRCV